jgi:hypothetical protein
MKEGVAFLHCRVGDTLSLTGQDLNHTTRLNRYPFAH